MLPNTLTYLKKKLGILINMLAYISIDVALEPFWRSFYMFIKKKKTCVITKENNFLIWDIKIACLSTKQTYNLYFILTL